MPLIATVKQGDLARELGIALGAVERKSTIPILGNVRIEGGGGRLLIQATDLEVGITTAIEASVDVPGVVTAPARKVLDYVRALPAEGDVTVKEGANCWLTIGQGRSKCRIAGMGPTAFPELPRPSGSPMRIKAGVLADMIRRVEFAIAKEESRFTIHGGLLELLGGVARMVCTDSHRIALANGDASGEEGRFIFPQRLMGLALKCLDLIPELQIEITRDENSIRLELGHRQLVARQTHGAFPDYQRVLPTGLPHQITVGRADLLAALGRVRSFADARSHATKWDVGPGEVRLAAMLSDVGESEEAVAVIGSTGGSMQAGFNAAYVVDFLQSVKTESVSIRFSSGSAAAVFVDGKGEAAGLYVVMPMRY